MSVRSILFACLAVPFVACAAPQVSSRSQVPADTTPSAQQELASAIAATDCGAYPKECGETSAACAIAVRERYAEAWRQYPSSKFDDVQARMSIGVRCTGRYQRQIEALKKLGR